MVEPIDDDEAFTSSDDYEDLAMQAAKASPAEAAVYAQLALMATVRESVGLLLDVFAPEGGEDEDDDDVASS